jgi:hypothetical protein
MGGEAMGTFIDKAVTDLTKFTGKDSRLPLCLKGGYAWATNGGVAVGVPLPDAPYSFPQSVLGGLAPVPDGTLLFPRDVQAAAKTLGGKEGVIAVSCEADGIVRFVAPTGQSYTGKAYSEPSPVTYCDSIIEEHAQWNGRVIVRLNALLLCALADYVRSHGRGSPPALTLGFPPSGKGVVAVSFAVGERPVRGALATMRD